METPRSTRSISIWLTLLALALPLSLVSLPATAAEGGVPMVLGADGTVTWLVIGAYEDLFPDGVDVGVNGASQVLALEQVDPAGVTVRWLVPDTEGSGVEPASLVLDDGSGAIFLLWEATINGLHPLLRLTRFEGEGFSSIVDITSGAFADKGTAQLVITREAEALRFVEEDGAMEGEIFEERTMVVHVVWWQESPFGSLKLYTPVVIENGRLSRQSPILDLSRFAPAGGADAEAEAEAALRDLLTIRQGETSQTVVLGFLEPSSGRLRTLRMDVVATALSDLGDKFGAHIVIVGMRTGDRRAMAEEVWPLLLDLGEDLHESIKIYMAAHLEDLILNSEEDLTPEGLEALAGRLSDEILTISAGVEAGGLARSESELVDAVPRLEEGKRHVLMVRVLSDRPAPEIGTPEGVVRLFLSSSGYHAMVAWEEDGRVFFRETADAGWGEIGSVEPAKGLEISAIYQMLERRVASR